LAEKHFGVFHVGAGGAIFFECFPLPSQFGFKECLVGAGFFELRFGAAERRFGGFDAGFGLGDRADVEQVGVARLDHGDERFAGDHFVTGIQDDAEDSAAERGGDDVLFSDARFAVFIDGDLDVAAVDFDDVDLDGLGHEGVAQAGDEQGRDGEEEQLGAEVAHGRGLFIHHRDTEGTEKRMQVVKMFNAEWEMLNEK
jgi:hypothetical protein